jgi:hypothetical protein
LDIVLITAYADESPINFLLLWLNGGKSAMWLGIAIRTLPEYFCAFSIGLPNESNHFPLVRQPPAPADGSCCHF